MSWWLGILDESGWKAKWIGTEPENILLEDRYYNHYGYQSEMEKSSTGKLKQVMIDLGETHSIQSLQLYPSLSKDGKRSYLFPLQFVVELRLAGTFLPRLF